MQETIRSFPDPQGRHALVIGASVAGLLAARILSDYFEQVTVIERDQLPEAAQTRKGVPQGQHVHLLMIRGADIIDDLFPNFFTQLEADGALSVDPTRDFRWFHFGAWKCQFPGPLRAHSQSRPLLEAHLCRRVAEKSNVRIRCGHEVTGLINTPDHPARISGVQIRSTTPNAEVETLSTALIVDASGRGSQTPNWLKALGYPVPETRVTINVGYASRVYRRPTQASQYQWKVLGIYPWPLDRKRIGYIFPIEDDRWMVTLSGYLGDHPSDSPEGFLEFARGLSTPELYEAIKDAEPLGPVAIHKFPADRLRHYERLSPMPDGLIVMGDAACSLNPIYGQGMTVAALEAQALQKCLQHQKRQESMTGFSSRFQKALAGVVQVPWLFTTSEDYRYQVVEGARPFGLGILQNYTERVSGLTATDQFTTLAFYKVLNMLEGPAALFHPRIVFKALLPQHASTRGGTPLPSDGLS